MLHSLYLLLSLAVTRAMFLCARWRPAQRLACVMIVAALLSSCAGSRFASGAIAVIDRGDVRSWNPLNVWERISTHPDTYVPRGMAKGAPVDEAHGTWHADPQDGTRFYIPDAGTEMFPRSLLEDQLNYALNKTSKFGLPLFILEDGMDNLWRGH